MTHPGKTILIARSNIDTTGEISTEMIRGSARYWLTEVGFQFGRPTRTTFSLHSSIRGAKMKWWREWGAGWRWSKP